MELKIAYVVLGGTHPYHTLWANSLKPKKVSVTPATFALESENFLCRDKQLFFLEEKLGRFSLPTKLLIQFLFSRQYHNIVWYENKQFSFCFEFGSFFLANIWRRCFRRVELLFGVFADIIQWIKFSFWLICTSATEKYYNFIGRTVDKVSRKTFNLKVVMITAAISTY